jgi:hypothetical protein
MPPVLINDRARKVFDLFIPGLDKDVDMASDLVKAMFRVNCTHLYIRVSRNTLGPSDRIVAQALSTIARHLSDPNLSVNGTVSGK